MSEAIKEIENTKMACEITDNCFEYLLGFIKEGMTEKEVAEKIRELFEERKGGKI